MWLLSGGGWSVGSNGRKDNNEIHEESIRGRDARNDNPEAVLINVAPEFLCQMLALRGDSPLD